MNETAERMRAAATGFITTEATARRLVDLMKLKPERVAFHARMDLTLHAILDELTKQGKFNGSDLARATSLRWQEALQAIALEALTSRSSVTPEQRARVDALYDAWPRDSRMPDFDVLSKIVGVDEKALRAIFEEKSLEGAKVRTEIDAIIGDGDE